MRRGAFFTAALAALLILPLLIPGERFTLGLACQVFLNVTIMMGVQIVLGLTKQFSLAQVAFYGIGAYTTALLTTHGVPTLLALGLSGLAAGAAAALVAIPAVRFAGPWLSLITFAFAQIIQILMARLKSVTGGTAGFYNIPRPQIAGISLTGEFDYYFLFLALAALAVGGALRLRDSAYGRIWLSIGDNPDIASALGVNVPGQRVLAFFVGSFIAGVAGGAFASYATFISPESFGLPQTIQTLTMLVIGGLESVGGVILAVLFVTLMSNYLMALHPWDLILYGLIIVVIMNVLPEGFGGVLRRLRGRRLPVVSQERHRAA